MTTSPTNTELQQQPEQQYSQPQSQQEQQQEHQHQQSLARFPSHKEPRVWFLSCGTCPTARALVPKLIAHGDKVATGVRGVEIEREDDRAAAYQTFLGELGEEERTRLKIINMDIRSIGQCQAAISETVEVWGRVDVMLCCTSEAVVGTVEELSASTGTLNLVRDQFETNYFGPVNIIKAVLPTFRSKRAGHLLVLTGITGHIGSPGLGTYCASGWALEGFCDSLAYEIAPFNIKMTILQPSMEVNLLTNKITFTPPHPAYSSDTNHAPFVRDILTRTIHRQSFMATQSTPPSAPFSSATSQEKDKSNAPPKSKSKRRTETPSQSSSSPSSSNLLSSNATESVSLFPPLPDSSLIALVAETVHAITAIGGHDNPPTRHIVGHEAVASVKEKLKTVSEELEDFVEVSGAVDIPRGEEVGSGPDNTAESTDSEGEED
ncbi:MAG: hypothetical protein M1833_001384 [Piccolia ochrophora]|nr:MAG: hypothetical protein M1833_001384 [Piccolia ochrophora]